MNPTGLVCASVFLLAAARTAAATTVCPSAQCFRTYRQAANACGATLDVFKHCCVNLCKQENKRSGFACAARDVALADPPCPEAFRRRTRRAEKDCALFGAAIPGCAVQAVPSTNPGGTPTTGFQCTAGAGPLEPASPPDLGPCGSASFCRSSSGLFNPAMFDAPYMFNVRPSAPGALTLNVTSFDNLAVDSAELFVRLGASAEASFTCDTSASDPFVSLCSVTLGMAGLPVPDGSAPCCESVLSLRINVTSGDITRSGTASFNNFGSDFCTECSEADVAADMCVLCGFPS